MIRLLGFKPVPVNASVWIHGVMEHALRTLPVLLESQTLRRTEQEQVAWICIIPGVVVVGFGSELNRWALGLAIADLRNRRTVDGRTASAQKQQMQRK